MNSAGYVYDALGRTTTVPAIDTAMTSGGNVTVAYHSTDLVDTITQGVRTTDYVLDVTGERVRSWTDNASGVAVQAGHHYDGDEDSPSWTQETAGRFTRPVSGLSAMAGIFDSGSAEVDWQITNLHGDLVAAIHGGDEGLSSTSEADEYGTPRDPQNVGSQRYGWLGSKQRAALQDLQVHQKERFQGDLAADQENELERALPIRRVRRRILDGLPRFQE
ncbi:hypothetical protein [Micromonospora sp. NPDC005203]|uniref:hypothetical protein n=1 Tax=Micromonospora sp. NPDC005203 TaxID=3364226 RepID=UPI00367A63B3